MDGPQYLDGDSRAYRAPPQIDKQEERIRKLEADVEWLLGIARQTNERVRPD